MKSCLTYLRIWICPCPLVRKNKSPVLFQLNSFTSNLNCSSFFVLWVFASIKVTKSSLLPTAIVLPSGDQLMLIFSPCQVKGKKYNKEIWFCSIRLTTSGIRHIVKVTSIILSVIKWITFVFNICEWFYNLKTCYSYNVLKI